MTIWARVRRFLGLPAAQFDSAPRPIDQLILEMAGRTGSRVSRAEALSVPAVQRGRNMICAVATLPLLQHGPRNQVVPNPLLEQIDPDVANVVTLAQTLEDLLFEGLSWWRITAFGWDGYPVNARHLDFSSVSVDPPANRSAAPLPSGIDPREGVVWVDGKPVSGKEIIRFDSPNPGVLTVPRAIRRAILLDKAAAMYADDPRPLDYFTPAEGADPADDDEVAAILRKWKVARKTRSTGYVPAALKYNTVDAPSPAELQLVELQRQAHLEIANAIGIDPEELGISTTSRTYFNAIDRRQSRINDVLSPFMAAITQRLSMGDVTKRGYRVAFDLDDYMRADPLTRWQVYKIGRELDVITPEEIRSEERMGPMPAGAERTPPPADEDTADEQDQSEQDQTEQVDATGDRAAVTFDRPSGLTLDAEVVEFTVDRPTRVIEGLALPYGKTATKFGQQFRFERGSLRWSDPGRVKLLRDHDFRQAIGRAEQLTDTPSGLRVRFKVARGEEGDRALALAEDGVLDGMSVGVDFDLAVDTVPDPKSKSTVLVRRADLREVSLTAVPAFDDARVSKVRAARNEGNPGMPEEHEPTEAQTTPPAAGGIQLNQDQVKTLLTRPGALEALVRPQQAPKEPAAPPGALTLTADQLDTLIKSGGLGTLLGVPQLTPAPQREAEQERRQTVNPVRRVTASTSVNEAMPYRFDRKGNLTRGAQHDFSTDLIAGSRGDGEAMERAQAFVRAQFADVMAAFDVDTTDVTALNPNRQRPDLYVDQREFQYPIWSAINKGTLQDATPFIVPKFNTASGLVSNHTQGTEPTPGAFTATSQTITPSAVSGKVEITREAWDAGGNPQLSNIIWRQMVRAWFEALEASAVALLDSLTPTGITLTTAAVDDALVGELEAALAALHYVRGGFRMRDFAVQIDLYKRLVDAKDADGRKLLPILGPVNANGTTASDFGAVMIGGLKGIPAWALAASGTVAASSYLFDREDVHGWATAPNRLQFEYRVAYVDVAIWGYKATACTDTTGVREVIYDPAA